ncbi:hypothetical protein AQUCO_03400047v1 [Aquilegia coerulea]|uniref:Uncharacterized protein n=1 Tax=Aquilegia coerulea TaxID=218851 RepID=A0A2G5CX94_AQUCA|nr:hypothetical protein AQUCO_03400047v1 [Aquilegia coerulea]
MLQAYVSRVPALVTCFMHMSNCHCTCIPFLILFFFKARTQSYLEKSWQMPRKQIARRARLQDVCDVCTFQKPNPQKVEMV